MELILLIAIAILVTVLLVLALTKGNNQNASGTITNSPTPTNAREPGGTETAVSGNLRMEMTQTLNQNMQQLQDVLHKNMMTTGELQRQSST